MLREGEKLKVKFYGSQAPERCCGKNHDGLCASIFKNSCWSAPQRKLGGSLTE